MKIQLNIFIVLGLILGCYFLKTKPRPKRDATVEKREEIIVKEDVKEERKVEEPLPEKPFECTPNPNNCDLVTSNGCCEPGQKCGLNWKGTSRPTLGCMPAGELTEGNRCTIVPDNCKKGYICYGPRICMKACRDRSDCAQNQFCIDIPELRGAEGKICLSP
jgi:hypothetical protein